MNDEQREALKQALADVISAAEAEDLWVDAIWYGRKGLCEMSDVELKDCASVWGVEVPR